MLAECWPPDKSFTLIRFIVTNFDTVQSLKVPYFMVSHFIILVLIRLICLVFSLVRLLFFSTFFEISSETGFVFAILSAILFPINSPVASAIL